MIGTSWYRDKVKDKENIKQQTIIAMNKLFKCPYNFEIILTAKALSKYIKENYPDQIQWNDMKKNEKQKYEII